MSPEKKKTTAKKAVTPKKAAPKKTVAKKAPVKKTAPKKTVAKKAAPKKAPAKKPVVAASVAPKTTASTTAGMSWLPWVLVAILMGVLAGIFMADMNMGSKFDNNQDMVVIGDNTWMPVPGKPLDVVVLNDEDCGQSCDPKASLDALRQNITPALMVTEISVDSADGQRLVNDFNLTSVPQFFFTDTLDEVEAGDGSRFVDNLPAGVMKLQGDLYHLNKAAVGFPTGKFIKTPDFADLDSEPSLGNGPVQVVEFTNYQCGFCKKLHDDNKDLIDQLVADNKITYVVKDFPMFGANDVFAHQAANCVLKEGGQELYWDMNAEIFAAQPNWSRADGAEALFVDMASGLGVDIQACMSDASVKAEVQADMSEGSTYGVTGTPALFIGTQFMPGAIGPDQFRAAVEAEMVN